KVVEQVGPHLLLAVEPVQLRNRFLVAWMGNQRLVQALNRALGLDKPELEQSRSTATQLEAQLVPGVLVVDSREIELRESSGVIRLFVKGNQSVRHDRATPINLQGSLVS